MFKSDAYRTCHFAFIACLVALLIGSVTQHISCLHACTCSFVSGDVMVVDGANWMWKPQLVTREMVSKVSRSVESHSRSVGTANTRSKL